MPEDYQAILNDLGVDTSTDPAPVADPAPVDNNQGQPADGNEGNAHADGNGTPAAQPAQPAQPNAEDAKRNQAFAEMRSANTKYKNFLSQLMKGANFNGSEEDFMNQLQEASYQRQAKTSQVSPEVLKRMDTLENQNRTLIDAQNRQAFAANLKTLQETLKLTDGDMREFLETAAKQGINLIANPATDLVMMYQGMFYEKLKARDIEAARQEWIAGSNKAGSATNPDGKSGKKDPTPTNVNTMAEFDSLLQSISNNNKK